MTTEHFDVMIVGAGLSGIDAAHHLQTFNRNKTYVILEQRERIGGTWDLFRYPGIRSDSDMLTMGFSFRPWTNDKAISPGADIRRYITDTARDEGIDKRIRFRHRITSAAWSSADARWTVNAVRTTSDEHEEAVTLTCNFLFSCAGYYRYDAGYTPEFPGRARFEGRVVHPQQWPEDLDYAGKRVVIIGSGATAVTLVPSLAKTAAHVTMLQRSPTYVVSMPEQDVNANRLRKVLPKMWAYRASRMKNVAFQTFVYQLAKHRPQLVRERIAERAREHAGPDFDVATHFTPTYNPWDQRMCLVPDADLFIALREGRASVATDEIETFTETGIQLKSGAMLAADIIVTATGLVLQPIGGIELNVDGRAIDLGQTLSYRGAMASGVPNFAYIFGYINASWTLKADMICAYISRLLNHMDEHGLKQVTPTTLDAPVAPFFEGFSSGYVQRGIQRWPKQGAKVPWRVHQNVVRDVLGLKWSSFDDDALKFEKPP